MFRPTVRVEFNHLPRDSDRIMKQVRAVIRKVAFDIEGNAKVAAPVDTGFLKNSITSEQVNEDHYRVTVGAEYGVYVDQGTWKTRPTFFFSHAVESGEHDLKLALSRIAP